MAFGWNSVTIDHPNSKIRFGRTWYYCKSPAGDTTTFFGSIQSVRIYNRPLTDAELTQNYNVDVSRFNITNTLPEIETQLAGNDVSSIHYGKLTSFKSKGTGNEDLLWRIFYKDNTNIYLISSKKDSTGEKPTTTSTLQNTSNTISDLGRTLNPLYTATANSWSMSTPREQISAYLLDSNNWDSYRDSAGNASWAIAGPPIEMYVASLRQTNPSLVGEVWAEPEYGYRLSGTIATSACIEVTLNKGIYGGDNLSYSTSSPCGSWGANNRILGIVNSNSKGWFWNQENWKWAGYTSGSSNYGIRPIVCIPINKFNYTVNNYL